MDFDKFSFMFITHLWKIRIIIENGVIIVVEIVNYAITANGHTKLGLPVLVRSPKSSNFRRG